MDEENREFWRLAVPRGYAGETICYTVTLKGVGEEVVALYPFEVPELEISCEKLFVRPHSGIGYVLAGLRGLWPPGFRPEYCRTQSHGQKAV